VHSQAEPGNESNPARQPRRPLTHGASPAPGSGGKKIKSYNRIRRALTTLFLRSFEKPAESARIRQERVSIHLCYGLPSPAFGLNRIYFSCY
jgi:hypothetical protein